MYMRVQDIVKIAKDPTEPRPLILCEYVTLFFFFECKVLLFSFSITFPEYIAIFSLILLVLSICLVKVIHAPKWQVFTFNGKQQWKYR